MNKMNVFQSSAIIIPDPEIEEFTWDFCVSPRSKIQKNIESVTFGGFTFNGLQFKSGFLADTDHKWGLSMYSNQINTFMSLPNRDLNHRYRVLESTLELISQEQVKVTHPLAFQRDEQIAAPRMLWTSYWVNSDMSWDDTIDTIRITFRIERETSRCLYTMVSQQTASKNREILSTLKHVDCTEFFMSDYLSDIILQCGDKEFPAHRFILSCRSSVFNRMFRTGMKEVEEGRVMIEAMEPNVLEELLRFIYCSEISPSIENICSDLFEASDRFDVQPLKIICESEMIKRVDAESALDMYMLAELHDSKLLKEKSYETIRRHKKQIFNDPETFKMFATKYPDIAYDLFSRFSH